MSNFPLEITKLCTLSTTCFLDYKKNILQNDAFIMSRDSGVHRIFLETELRSPEKIKQKKKHFFIRFAHFSPKTCFLLLDCPLVNRQSLLKRYVFWTGVC